MRTRLYALMAVLALFRLHLPSAAFSCTGISLTARDGSVAVGRTVEWALSDAGHYRIAIFPRSRPYASLTPEGKNGMSWTGRYGFLSMTAYGEKYGPDGLNEKGLSVGMYYLPGFAGYAAYDPSSASRSLSVGDFMQWMLSSFSTVAEVRRNLDTIRVINVEDKRFGGAPLPFHWKVSDPGGASIVIEIVEEGRIKVYDAVLGVITNAPTYDWHLLNLRNYLQLSSGPKSPIRIGEVQLSPLGAGSGMIGLPGDFTPPSRFVRAAAFTASVRPLPLAEDAVFEAFRILDSFNIPLGSILPRESIPTDIEGATQITSVSDLKNLRYYYHTMLNREVRVIDLKKIDFATVPEQVIDDDSGRRHEVRELQPVR